MWFGDWVATPRIGEPVAAPVSRLDTLATGKLLRLDRLVLAEP